MNNKKNNDTAIANGMIDEFEKQLQNLKIPAEKLTSSKAEKQVDILLKLDQLSEADSTRKTSDYRQQAANLIDQFNLKHQNGIVQFLEANELFNKGNLHSALTHFQRSLKDLESKRDPQLYSRCLNTFGITHGRLGNPEKAFSAFTEALELLEKLGLQHSTAYLNTINNIGIMFFLGNDWQKARHYYQQALSLAADLGDVPGKENALLNIGVSFKEEKNYNEASPWLQQGLESAESHPPTPRTFMLLMALADNYSEQGDFSEVYPLLEKAQKMCREFSDKASQIEVLFYFAKTKHNEQDFAGEIFYLQQALELSDSEDFARHRLNIYEWLSAAYEKTGSLAEALSCYKKFMKLNQQLITEESMKKVKEIQTQLETTEKEKQIDLLQKEQKIKDLKLQAKEKQLQRKKEKEKEIKRLNHLLEKRVKEELQKHEEQQQLLIRKSRLESLGKLAAGITHEIAQPITRISLGVGNILARQQMEKLDADYLRDKCESFYQDISRIEEIIEQVKVFSRQQKDINFEPVDVNKVIRNSLKMFKTQVLKTIELNVNLASETGHTLGNEHKLEQVLINLLTNSRDAIEENQKTQADHKGKIKVSSKLKSNIITIEIEDNGCGISSRSLPRVFDPFFTTKDPERGTGLGLSIVYGIIEEMQGKIKVTSRKDKFTRFTISLPRIEKK